MKTFTYTALVEPGDDGGFVVTFPAVPEAITDGATLEHALAEASDALGVALLSYSMRGLPLPVDVVSAPTDNRVTVAPEIAAKLAVLEAFAQSGLTKAELARRLGKDEKEVRRVLDPHHATKLPLLVTTLGLLGRRLVVGVEAA